MGRRTFNREFKLEAVRLVRDRGLSVAQACRDLEIAESVLRRWMRETEADPRHAFPGREARRRASNMDNSTARYTRIRTLRPPRSVRMS